MNPDCVISWLTKMMDAAPVSMPAPRYDNGFARLFGSFDSVRRCNITIGDYVRRLFRLWSSQLASCDQRCKLGGHCGCASMEYPSEPTLACLLVQRVLQRSVETGAGVWISNANAHRLYLAALSVAYKLLHDSPRSSLMRDLALLGGVPLREILHLEVIFLYVLQFELYVAPEDFARFCHVNCRASALSSRSVAVLSPLLSRQVASPTESPVASPTTSKLMAAIAQASVGRCIVHSESQHFAACATTCGTVASAVVVV